jgi:hypothetical protein
MNAAGPIHAGRAVWITVPVTIAGIEPLIVLASVGPTAPNLNPATVLLPVPVAKLAAVRILTPAFTCRHLSRVE